MHLSRHLLAILMLLSARVALGQQFSVLPLGTEQGLSCNYISEAAIDKYGYLWFATDEGLNRFDGQHFSCYYKNKVVGQGLSSSELNCVIDDRREPVLWIGTKNDGLNAFNYDTGEFTCYRHDSKDNSSIVTNDITSMCHGEDNQIWLTTYWKGVDMLDLTTRKFTHYNKSNVKGMTDEQLWCAVYMGNGLLMVGHVDAGVSIIDTRNRTARNFRHDDNDKRSLASNDVFCICKDNNGVFWVGTSAGLDVYDPMNQSFIHVADQQIGNHRIFCIAQLSDGRIWVGTEMNGIAIITVNRNAPNRYHNARVEMIKEGDTDCGLTGNTLRTIVEDRYHNVWAGLYGGGVNMLTKVRPPFSIANEVALPRGTRMTENSVMAIAVAPSGHVWTGTDGGTMCLYDKKMARMSTEAKNMGTSIQTATYDAGGKLWIGTFNRGALVGSAASMKHLPDVGEDVRCFYEDRKYGTMWIGTSTGLYAVDVKTLQTKRHFDIGNRFVRALAKDRRGNLWVGYYGIGIQVFSPKMKLLAWYRTENTGKLHLPTNAIAHLFCDSSGRIWAASNEGLICMGTKPGQQATVYDQASGLTNIHIRAITQDRAGNIWMSHNRGISCLPKGADRIVNYNRKDGVVQTNFNDGCVAHDARGNIYFGSASGLCYFSPEKVLSRQQSPRPYIMSLSLLSNIEERKDSVINLNNRKKITLNHDENTFTITFNTLNYALNSYVEYSYKLEGIQNEWMMCDAGQITMRDLPTGSYRLLVRSRMHNQQWNEEVAELIIAIKPPLWLSWWAKLIYAFIVVMGIYTALRIYNRHLRLEYMLDMEKINHEKDRKDNEDRLRFFTNIAHELRTPLTLILGPLDDLSHSTDIAKAAKHKLAVIHQSAVRLNELITQILEFRKTETNNRALRVQKANIVDTVHEISLKYEELKSKPNVTIRFVAPENPINMYFDREVIAIAVDNLVSNAIKYTDSGTVDISVERRRSGDKHLVDITVSDTGYGISQEALPHVFERYYQENGSHQASGTGIGLSLVKNLVTLHEGTIKVESSIEQGSSFIVTLDEQNIYPTALHGKKESPAEETPRNENEAESTANAATPGRLLMLVVEDNNDIREYITTSFADEYDTIEAVDGKDGLGKALDRIPDIIISDVMMPRMDGNEMCRILKSDVRTSHIPIILLTAKDSQEAKEDGYDAGADSYITKPFTHSLLNSRVNNLLAQRRRMQTVQSAPTAENTANNSKEDLTEKKQQLRESLNHIDKEFFDKLDYLIGEGISGDVDVNMLASQLAMSTSTLYRKMKALTGMSTNEYIRKYKMQYAERLLLEGKYSISEISFMVGMNSIAYFRRCFKAEYGMIPSEYLKQLK